MSFLGSIFLWALPLVAVPIVLHLMKRRQRQVVQWGAMQFLAPEALRQRRMKRLDDLLLLIVRTLAIAGIILAMAQPMISAGFLGWGSTQEEIILILDVSMSTDQTEGNKVVFDSIREEVNNTLTQLDNGNQVRILLAGERAQWLYPAAVNLDYKTRKEIEDKLKLVKPTLASAEMGAALLTALEADTEPETILKRILVFTDGTTQGWKAESNTLWQKIHTVQEQAPIPTVIHIWTKERSKELLELNNISIEQISTLRSHVPVNEPVTLTATIKNRGTKAQSGTVLEWSAEGEKEGITTLPTLDPGQTVDVDFEYIPTQADLIRITCETTVQDKLKLDNQAETMLTVVEKIPLLIVGNDETLNPPKNDIRLLLTALGQSNSAKTINQWSSIFKPQLLSYAELEGEDLDQYACLILTNTPTVSDAVIQNLTRFVRNGGGLWLILGEETDIDNFNMSFHRGGAGLSPLAATRIKKANEEQKDHFVLRPPNREHSALKIVGDLERLDIAQLRVDRFINFELRDNFPPHQIWFQTAIGDPIAVENFLGRGHVIVQSLPIDLNWSNLPICRLYVPMVQEWLLYLAQPSASQLNLQLGESFRFTLQDKIPSESLQIHTPLGFKTTPAIVHQENNTRIYYSQTDWPGSYQLYLNKNNEEPLETAASFNVARNTQESDLTRLTKNDRDKITQYGGLRFVSNPLEETSRYEKIEPPQSPFWSQLLILVLGCLTVEMLITLFIARRRYSQLSG